MSLTKDYSLNIGLQVLYRNYGLKANGLITKEVQTEHHSELSFSAIWTKIQLVHTDNPFSGSLSSPFCVGSNPTHLNKVVL
jgi:hypothetical protein